ncbi:hypothetical protein [Paraclostridium sordellii]|uniref:hypothetical protein n=1 Tax=Paraclostridium sordellii TaxID=1505 RepID=UPI0030D24AE3
MNIDNVYIDKDIVLKFLGYGKRKAPYSIKKIIDEEILNINDILDIKENNFTGNYIIKCFKECEKAYSILYTIGSEIDKNINYHMSNNDMMRGLVLDKIGIVALDYINENIKKYLEDNNPNLNILHEIYPGDKEFSIENQRNIYNYFKNEYININEYNQMNPIKSVAMVICMGSYKI